MVQSRAHSLPELRSHIFGRLRITCSFTLLVAALAPAARAQTKPATPSIGARVGYVYHELAGHSAGHPTLGLEAFPLQLAGSRLGFGVDGWLDGIDLGSVFGGRTVDARYLLYGAWAEVGTGRFFASVGAGGQTVFFGERYEAAALLPKSSTGPQGSLGIGSRIPLTGPESAWMLRLEGRGHAVYAEVFDPTGVEQGRELQWMPAAALRVIRTIR